MRRDENLALFLGELAIALEQKRDARASRMVQDVYARLKEVGGAFAAQGQTIPVCDYLDRALARSSRDIEGLAGLVETIQRISAQLIWRPHAGSVPDGELVTEHVPGNTTIIGPGGIEDRSDVRVGMSLLAPRVVYPDHRHPPPEVYLVLTDGHFRQAEGDWFAPGPGGVFFNTPGIVHAMRAAADTPLLAIWLLDVASVQN